MTDSGRKAVVPRPPLTSRLTSRQWLAVDIAAAVLAMVVITFELRVVHWPRFDIPTADVAAATSAATLPVAVRRLWPLPVFVVVSIGVAVLAAIGRDALTSDLMLGMAAYMAALRLPKTAAIASLVISEAAVLGGLLTQAAAVRADSGLLHSMLAAAAMWFVGAGVRERRRYRAGLAEQQAQRQRAEAERARHAVQDERLRIARDLHDVLAHSLSVVTVQAGVGRRVGATRPDEALRALRSVEEAGRGALDELRRLLCLLRGDDEPDEMDPVTDDTGAPGPVPALVPAPGLADLDRLAAMVRKAGVAVRVEVSGDAPAVPSAAALTTYRIVQEALTNVVRHAPGAEATVRVGIESAGVRVQVTDTGRGRWTAGPTGGGPGHGIMGMRERAAMFGGTLQAGPRPDGGFGVSAFLPVHAASTGRVA